VFDIKEPDVMGQTNKLLFNIWKTLSGEVKSDMKRPEMLAIIKGFKSKPEGWTKLSNNDLKKLIKDGENK
jgi:hypothetical protein